MDDIMANQADEVIIEPDYILPEGFEEGMESFEELSEEEVATEELKVDEEGDPEEDAEEAESSEEEDNGDEVEEEDTTEALTDLEVKFLKETKKLGEIDREDLKTYIQKGMNYDRMQEKLDLSNAQTDEFQEVADMYKMPVDKLLEALREQYFTDKSKAENRNINDVRKEFNDGRKDYQQKMLERFMEKYPDVDVSELPQEILDATVSGSDLISAYEAAEKDNAIKSKDEEISNLNEKIKGLEKQLKTKKQNAKTKQKGVVKSTGGATDGPKDDFLAGFYGE